MTTTMFEVGARIASHTDLDEMPAGSVIRYHDNPGVTYTKRGTGMWERNEETGVAHVASSLAAHMFIIDRVGGEEEVADDNLPAETPIDTSEAVTLYARDGMRGLRNDGLVMAVGEARRYGERANVVEQHLQSKGFGYNPFVGGRWHLNIPPPQPLTLHMDRGGLMLLRPDGIYTQLFGTYSDPSGVIVGLPARPHAVLDDDPCDRDYEESLHARMRLWEEGMALKARFDWCPAAERTMRLAGADECPETGPAVLSAREVADLPEGSLVVAPLGSGEQMVFRRDNASTNPARTVKVVGPREGHWTNYFLNPQSITVRSPAEIEQAAIGSRFRFGSTYTAERVEGGLDVRGYEGVQPVARHYTFGNVFWVERLR